MQTGISYLGHIKAIILFYLLSFIIVLYSNTHNTCSLVIYVEFDDTSNKNKNMYLIYNKSYFQQQFKKNYFINGLNIKKLKIINYNMIDFLSIYHFDMRVF